MRINSTLQNSVEDGKRLAQKTYETARCPLKAAISLVSMLLILTTLLPTHTHAGVLSDIWTALIGTPAAATAPRTTGDNVQTLAVLKPAMNENPAPATGGGDVTVVDNSALVPDEGPSGTLAEIERPKNPTISVYVVRQGDTLATIADLFDVSPNTILWANDLPKGSKVKVGQTLTILPITGLKYTVKKGDTLASVAKMFNGDIGDIASFNGIDTGTLAVGDTIIIPDGEVSYPVPSSKALAGTKTKGKKGVGAEPAHDVGPAGSASENAYYIAPLARYIKTQGIHGYNAVDLAAPVGSPMRAAADGTVIVAREGGWNGGYGSYIVIQHANGSQTLYGHASKVSVSVGQHVDQGDIIGNSGNSGRSTGPHVHFEIRNGIKNPF